MADLNWLKGIAEQNLGSIGGMQSAWGGVQNINDVRKMFGVPDAAAVYNPLKKQLGIQRAGAQNRALRSAGKSATPGMSAVDADVGYAGALQGLLSGEGQMNADTTKFLAGLLGQSKSGQDQFSIGKAGAYNQAIGQFGNIQQMIEQMKGPEWGEILTGILTGVAPIATAGFMPGGFLTSLLGLGGTKKPK